MKDKPDSERIFNISPPRILKGDIESVFRDMDTLLSDIEAERKNYVKTFTERCVLAEGEGFKEGLKVALENTVGKIVELENIYKLKLQSVKPELAHMLSETLDEIVGDFDDQEVVARIISKKVDQLSSFEEVRFVANPKTALLVKRVVSDFLDERDVQFVVSSDSRIAEGRILIETEESYFDIGIVQQSERAKEIFAETIQQFFLCP